MQGWAYSASTVDTLYGGTNTGFSGPVRVAAQYRLMLSTSSSWSATARQITFDMPGSAPTPSTATTPAWRKRSCHSSCLTV